MYYICKIQQFIHLNSQYLTILTIFWYLSVRYLKSLYEICYLEEFEILLITIVEILG
jgi:hypothetical protein